MSFKIRGPAVISFSGGRTSAYLLRRCLDEGLGPETHVVFANTGKEHEKTLDFVQAVSQRWSVPIRWLEYRRTRWPKYRSEERATAQHAIAQAAGRSYELAGKEPGFAEVTYETASRNGEPFENMIDLNGLPNFATPHCSTELKTRVIKRFMLAQGYEHWDSIVGIRADEAQRAARMRANASRERWDVDAPLVAAGVTSEEVLAFWLGPDWMPGRPFPEQLPQGFDLGLQPELGNCDLCFKKQRRKLVQITIREPRRLDWWEEQERRTQSMWREQYGSLARVRRAAEEGEMPDMFEDGIACACTD